MPVKAIGGAKAPPTKPICAALDQDLSVARVSSCRVCAELAAGAASVPRRGGAARGFLLHFTLGGTLGDAVAHLTGQASGRSACDRPLKTAAVVGLEARHRMGGGRGGSVLYYSLKKSILVAYKKCCHPCHPCHPWGFPEV